MDSKELAITKICELFINMDGGGLGGGADGEYKGK